MNRTFLTWTRTIHIYLTMGALGLMLFFAVTGFTVNHEDWFGATTPRTRNVTGTTPVEWVKSEDKLRIVEHLRSAMGASGAMTDFETDEEKYHVVFKGPGRICEATIARADGKTDVEIKTFGLMGRINDLHRGRDAGEAWRWVIDASALLIVLASVTGLILWMALPKRRKLGIAWLVVGVAASVGFYWAMVP
jgi:uncharacterized protein